MNSVKSEPRISITKLKEIFKQDSNSVVYEMSDDTCGVEACESQAEFLVKGNWSICMGCFEQAHPSATTTQAYRDRVESVTVEVEDVEKL